jgi:hypothetical protein
MVAVREQVRRWVQHVSTKVVKALGRGTYGGYVVGQDGQGLLRTLHRQVRRLLARRAAFFGRFARHRYTASTARRRDTLECTCCSEDGSALRPEGVRELPKLCGGKTLTLLSPSCEHRWEAQQCTGSLPRTFTAHWFLQPPIGPGEHPSERRKP